MNEESNKMKEEKRKEIDVTAIEHWITSIAELLIQQYGEPNRKSISSYLSRKKNTILKDLFDLNASKGIHTHYPYDKSVKICTMKSYEKEWGRLTLNGRSVYANSLLMPILCEVLISGFTSVASAVRIRETIMDALSEYAIENSSDLVWKRNFNWEGIDIYETKVNKESLRYAIDEWKIELKYAIEKDRKKLLSYIHKGETILSCLSEDDMLIQEASIADNGRLYFKGVNLQYCPKKVRHAALGKCHSYDIRVCAFGVMAGVAEQYAKEQGLQVKFHNILGFIARKEAYRIHITRHVYPEETKYLNNDAMKRFFGYYNVKQALTSIGFGAKRNATSVWMNAEGKFERTSILDCFKGNKAEAERFLDCQMINDLLDEYVECSDIVLLRIERDPVFAKEFKFPDKMKKGEKLAFIYQHMESLILADMITILGPDNMLLPVHDGCYVKHKIDIMDLWFKLNVPFITNKDYIQFDHTSYMPASVCEKDASTTKSDYHYEYKYQYEYNED